MSNKLGKEEMNMTSTFAGRSRNMKDNETENHSCINAPCFTIFHWLNSRNLRCSQLTNTAYSQLVKVAFSRSFSNFEPP